MLHHTVGFDTTPGADHKQNPRTNFSDAPALKASRALLKNPEVDGYVIEGHVPVREINRLLNERPEIIGLAVPGMPIGSPGMDGSPPEPFDVFTFDALGNREVFASYP